MNVPLERNGRWPAAVSIAICLLAPVALLMITLPDDYLSLDGEGDGVFAVFLLSPYLVLALFAWCGRRHRRQSIALFVLTVPLVGFGVWLLAAEANGYRTALAESPRGPDYMRHRYQRMELFIVPVLQWLACLAIGSALLVDGCWRRFQRRGDGK
jgi:cytochrome c biogenesis factor